MKLLMNCPMAPRLRIREEDAGLHFLLEVDTELSEETLVAECAAKGLEIRTLGSYYHTSVPPQAAHCLVVNYASLREEELEQALQFQNEE